MMETPFHVRTLKLSYIGSSGTFSRTLDAAGIVSDTDAALEVV